MIRQIFGTQITQIGKKITQIGCVSLMLTVILIAVSIAVCAYAEEKTGEAVSEEAVSEEAVSEEAASEEAVSEEAVIKEMAGPIIYLTPRAKPEVIYIGNEAANTDYSFIIDKNTRVEHMKNLIDLKTGDTVKIKYEEITEITKMGGRKVAVDKRVAKVISFVRAGAKKEEPGSASKQEKNILVSD